MRTLILTVFFLLLCVSLPAAQPLAERLAPLKKVKVTSADYTQIRTIADLDMQVRITGSMVYEKDGRLRWQADSPVRTITIIGQESLQNYDCETQKLITLDGKKFPWLKLIRECFTDSFTGDPEKLQKRFQIKEITPYILELTPEDPLLSDWVQMLQITFRQDFTAVEKVEIREKSGDRLEILYHNIKIDPVLPATLWKLPPEQ